MCVWGGGGVKSIGRGGGRDLEEGIAFIGKDAPSPHPDLCV